MCRRSSGAGRRRTESGPLPPLSLFARGSRGNRPGRGAGLHRASIQLSSRRQPWLRLQKRTEIEHKLRSSRKTATFRASLSRRDLPRSAAARRGSGCAPQVLHPRGAAPASDDTSIGARSRTGNLQRREGKQSGQLWRRHPLGCSTPSLFELRRAHPLPQTLRV
jgi:hypothetical protein